MIANRKQLQQETLSTLKQQLDLKASIQQFEKDAELE